mgnify:CR=1 FL=1
MKIGDRVRFLSDVGGGIVKGFRDKNIVLVEDEDGFQIPTLMSEVVVVTTDDYNIAKVDTTGRNKKPEQQKKEIKDNPKQDSIHTRRNYDDDEEIDLADIPITFKPKPEERPDGDKLNVFISFVPQKPTEFSKTNFDCYIINDCNYFIAFTFLSKLNNSYKFRTQGVIEPNTKLFVEEVTHSMLQDFERVGMQIIAYKEDKPFLMKPAMNVDLRIDTTKFFKYHTFRQTLFFEQPALEITVVKDDMPTKMMTIDPDALKAAMTQKQQAEKERNGKVSKKSNVIEIVEVDLHAGELLETTRGMSPADIKEYQLGVFRNTMDKYIKRKGQKIVFIHGKGDGVLRCAIVDELKRKYKPCTYQDASFQQYGFGATMVIIR